MIIQNINGYINNFNNTSFSPSIIKIKIVLLLMKRSGSILKKVKEYYFNEDLQKILKESLDKQEDRSDKKEAYIYCLEVFNFELDEKQNDIKSFGECKFYGPLLNDSLADKEFIISAHSCVIKIRERIMYRQEGSHAIIILLIHENMGDKSFKYGTTFGVIDNDYIRVKKELVE